MNKERTTKRIQEIESELAKLREDLNKPEGLQDFQVGDIIVAEGSLSTVLIVSANYRCYRDKGQKYLMAGLNGLEVFSNYQNGATKEEILNYINGYKNPRIAGNINNEVKNLISSYARE